MKVKSISASNFKGRTFEYQLGSVTIFHGENGAGKSAVAEAIRLAMLGYDPRVPKKKADIWEAFASEESMAVTVTFEDGSKNQVDLIQRKGTVSGTIAVNLEVPAYLLDMNSYWKLSRADRSQFLMSQCVPASMLSSIKALESDVVRLETAISNDNSRRTNLRGAISAQVAAPGELKITALPVDHGEKITDTKNTVREGEKIIQNLTNEKLAASRVQQKIEGLNEAAKRATAMAPSPVCEHCGQLVNALRDAVAVSFSGQLKECFHEAQGHRPLSEIEANFLEWNTYLMEARKALAEMENAQNAWNQLAFKEQTALKNQRELDELEPRLESNREKLKELIQERKDKLSQCVDPLLQSANAFLEPTLGMKMALEDGHIGFRAGSDTSRFLPFTSLSGAQELMASAGLQIALAGESPVKLVMMDELGRLSEATKTKLVGAIESLLKAKVIDQFVGCDVSATGYGRLSTKAFVEVA